MPSWKPDCLRSSSTFNQIKLLHADIHDTKNPANSSKSSLRDTESYKGRDGTLTKSDRALSFQNASNSKLQLQKGYSVVDLVRSNNSQFGLTIAGGTDKDSRPRICDLKAGSIAHRSDELQIGDMIISINGIKTQGLKHEEIIDLIKNAGDGLCLEFEYNLPPWPIHPHHAVRSQTVHIQLEKENASYGFTLRGGFSDEKQKSRPLIVTNIRSGGSADREGTLKIGDRIIAINGINVLNASLQESYNIIKQCKGNTLFLVEYDSAIVDSIKNSNGPLLIEIEKSPGSSIGIKLTMAKSTLNNGKNQILVESVKPASIADRCGAIYVGDQILSIDDVSFEHVTLAEANQILKNCVGEFSRVEILPLSQMLAGKYPNSHNNTKNNDIYENGGGSSTKSNSSTFTVNSSSSAASAANNFVNNFHLLQQQQLQIQQQQQQQANNTANQLSNNSLGNFVSSDSLVQIGQNHYSQQNLNDLTLQSLQNIMQKNSRFANPGPNKNSTLLKSSRDRQNSISSINSCSASLSSNQVSHSEAVEFILKTDENTTFGFTLQGAGLVMSNNQHSSDIQNIVPYPIVGYVEPNSAAEKCSLMQPGDRIVSVNQRSFEGLSVEEARQIIKESGATIRLEIEFDVADTIMLTSGVFQVKLLKKGLDVGITVQYPRYWKAENYPFISDIKKGSVAYRNGMLQRGDTILFIDNICLRNKNIGEIVQLLKSTDEILKLKIRKEEPIVEEPDEKIVIYTVEMQRNGGPLGITISGSDDLFEPMFVSGLTEGGLAERTNAIHIGDIILAINNISLRGKSLSEAIELLQNADDMVTLKISRKLDKANLRLNIHGHNPMMGNGYQRGQHQMMNERDEFSDSLSKSSQHFVSESGSLVNGANGHQYLPFPMDMTNFIKSKVANGQSQVHNDHSNNNNPQQPIQSQSNINNGKAQSAHKYASDDVKKKAASLDSINAVERELDEVLKDLELNSQDLNDQLNENVYSTQANIELPISIQRGNNNNRANNKTQGELTDSYEQSMKNLKYHMKVSNAELDFKKQQLDNMRKRQNIVSTYEMCHDCFDNCGVVMQSNGEMGTCQHHGQQAMKAPPKSNKPQVSDFAMSYNGTNGNKGSPQHQPRYHADMSNGHHDPYMNGTGRRVLTQINESVVEGTNQPSLIRSGKNIEMGGSKPIVSQKVVTIGLPNGQKMADQSTSPNLADSRTKSIPIQKTQSLLKSVPEKEEKLDKLPPVPPSSWSNRRNQPQYASNSRLRSRSSNKTPTNETNHDTSSSSDHQQQQRNPYYQNDLNIQESGTTSSFEEESSSSSSTQKSESTLQSNINPQPNSDFKKQASANIDSDGNNAVEVTVSRDPRYKDFGISIADNFFGSGILISKVRNASPADESSYLQPFTQIYKINNMDCTQMDVTQVSAIISNEQSNVMRLLVSEKPTRVSMSNDTTLTVAERKMNLQSAYAISSSRATAL